MKEKVKEFIGKSNKKHTITKMILSLILSILLAFALECKFFDTIYGFKSIDRIMIFIGIILFISLHGIFKLSKIYEFIYIRRYILAGIFLVMVVLGGYSGSSITNYNDYIQGGSTKSSFKPILGIGRTIRSDEWAVNTPLIFSQQNLQGEKYPYFNMNIRGTSTDMFSIINAPVADIVSIGKPFNVGYLLFGNEKGLSFWWYGRLIALLLISFELCMIITKDKKIISLLGALMITFAPATQWWYSNFIADILIFGGLALILINLYMTNNKNWIRYLSILGVGFCAISYVFIFYPAWLLSFGYIFLALFIWIVLKNMKNFKFYKRDLIVIFITLVLVALIFLRFYMISNTTLSAVMHTDYPGERFELGGQGEKTVFSYVYEMFFAYKNTNNPCEYSSMISFFPIPIILAVIVLIRNKEKRKELLKFLIPILIVSIILTLWVFIQNSKTFASVTFLYMVTSVRAAVALSFSQLILLIYLISNISNKDKILTKKITLLLVPILSAIIVYIGVKTAPENYLNIKMIGISFIMVLLITYLLFNINSKKEKNFLIIVLFGLTIFSSFTINPVIKGISVIYEKPISKEIQKIVSKDPNALWIVDNMNFTIPNYIIANGAKVVNSTNYYPNKELYIKLFGEKLAQEENIRGIYNRYAHISIEIVENESKLEILYDDAIKIYINREKLDDINIKYIVTSRKLEELNLENLKFVQLYNEQGVFIYEVKF